MSGTGGPFAANALQLLDALAYEGIPVLLGAMCRKIDGNRVTVEVQGAEQALDADTVVISVGFHAEMGFYHEANLEIQKNIWCIGDAKTPSNILYAVKDGNAVGRAI